MRNYNSTVRGGGFSTETIVSVWTKASPIPGLDPSSIRKDSCGARIKFHDYGDTSSTFGWEIDHITPVARGGTDHLSNLQPLQWENNRHKADDWPDFECEVRA